MKSGAVCGMLLLWVLAACDGGSSRAPVSPVMVSVEGAERVSAACRAAVRFAAAIPDVEDTVTDLDDAIRACQTPDDWAIATAMFPAALDGRRADAFLESRCALPGLAQVPLCRAPEG